MTDGKYTRRIGTLVTTFFKPSGQSNLYILFVYIPQKKINNTQGQESGSINTDLINFKSNIKKSYEKL